MAVGLSAPGKLWPVKGLKLATTNAGIRYSGRDDMVLMQIAQGANTAATFTLNKYCAAPVTVAKENMAHSRSRALLINAGNANAGTGQQGLLNAKQSCSAVAETLGLQVTEVLPFSTGVIGEQLPMSSVLKGIDALTDNLAEDNWLAAAEAIMTTDTVAKAVSEQIVVNGQTVTITGIAKGSGMICPNMATMLSYVATDAEIEPALLQDMLQRGADASFNRITVDSDTSTNDALVLIATAQCGVSIESADSEAANDFYACLEKVLILLATAVVRDAEGATKFVKVQVNTGASAADCKHIAYSVAHSPLVKTALFASDPNWGRILAAIGKAPVEKLDINKVGVNINGVHVIEQGEPAANYTEAAGKAVFAQEEITIDISLNVGRASHHVWTSDLSHDYVSINADYRS